MTATKTAPSAVPIPESENGTISIAGHEVQLTNLGKIFWPELKLTKRELGGLDD